MKAVLCNALDGIESLTISEIESPVAKPNSVIVRVHAVALNFFDTLIVKGQYQFKPELPFSPGAEIAGTVEAIGENVEGFAVGEKVAAYMKWGGCRELVNVDTNSLIRIPENVSMNVASSVSVTYGTVMHAYVNRANLKNGETVAVLGAAGGVGQAAVEIAKLVGAKVIACASSQEKLRVAKKLGANELVDYSRENLKDKLKSLTDGRGVDVVFDPVGGDLAEQALRATGWRGRFLTVGYATGTIPRIPLNLLLLKGCDILGVFWGEATVREPEQNSSNIRQIFEWISKGKVNPIIHGTYPMSEYLAALRELAERRALGKVVINPNQ